MDVHILKENTIVLDRNRFLRNKLELKNSRYYFTIYILQGKKKIINKFISTISVIIFFLNLIIVDE